MVIIITEITTAISEKITNNTDKNQLSTYPKDTYNQEI
jgi:hypothetical protein